MKIIIALYKYFYWGGLQKDTLRLAEEAIKRGHEVTVFTTAWDNPPENIHIELTDEVGISNVQHMRAFNNAWKERLSKGDFDVSVAMNRVENADFYFAADSCLMTYYKHKYPNIVLKMHPRYRFFLDMERKVCGKNSPTKVWYISPFQKNDFMHEYGTPASHFIELPPGMNPDCIRPPEQEALKIRNEVRNELGLIDSDIAAIIVGSNIKRKGIDRLFTAASMLEDKWKSRIKLILVGKLDATLIDSLVEKTNMKGKYILTGPRQDVNKLLLASDIMVHPAREEGTGTVLIEGIAAGLPVMCTAICGFSPIVANAAGLVIPEPFSMDNMVKMLSDTFENLSEITVKSARFGRKQNFTARQSTMLDNLEQKYMESNK